MADERLKWWSLRYWRSLARKGDLDRLKAIADRLAGFRVEPPLTLSRPSRAGRRLRLEIPDALWATLAGSGPPYDWVDFENPARTGTANAYPYNGETGLAGEVAWLVRKPTSNDYRFERISGGDGEPPPICGVSVYVFSCCNGRLVGVTVTATLGAFSVSGVTGAGGLVVLDITGGGAGHYTISASGPRISASTTADLGCPGRGNLVFLHGPTLPDTLFYTDDLGSVTLTKDPSVNAWTGCAAVPGGLDYCHLDAYGNPTTADFPRSVILSCRSDGTGVGVVAGWPAAGDIDPSGLRFVRNCGKPLACQVDRLGNQNPFDCTRGVVDPSLNTFTCQAPTASGGLFPTDAHCETAILSGTFAANAIGLSSWTASP